MKKLLLCSLLPALCLAHGEQMHHSESHPQMHQGDHTQDMHHNENLRHETDFNRHSPEFNSYNPTYVNPNPSYQYPTSNTPTIQDLEEFEGIRQ